MNCPNRRALALLAVASLLLPALASPGVAVEPLRWKFAAGDEHRYETTQSFDMTMTLPAGNQIVTHMDQIIDMAWKVDVVDDAGTAKITQQIERVRMKMQGAGGQQVDFDSKSDKPPEGIAAMVAPLFKAMTAHPFQVEMTPQGQITSVKAPAELLKAMQQGPGAAALGELTDEEGFKKLIQRASLVLPGTLEEGQSWTTTMTVKNPQVGVQKVETLYRYAGEKDGMARIEPTMAITFDRSEAVTAPQADVKVTGQESSGEIRFNRELGLQESATINHDMTMEIAAAGQQYSQRIKQSVVIKRLDKGAGQLDAQEAPGGEAKSPAEPAAAAAK